MRFLRRSQPPEETREKLEAGLERSRSGVFGQLSSLFERERITEDTWDSLEEVLVTGDVGVETTLGVVEHLRAQTEAGVIRAPRQLKQGLREELLGILNSAPAPAEREGGLIVMLVVGVNGVGKTTTIPKIASRLQAAGARVVVGAADTFRAAAIDQLQVWGDRIGVPVISGAPNSDPAAVVHDALAAARARNADVLLVDTAGRLHTKFNLMEELKKIERVIVRGGAAAPESLLVLDATTGQNGLIQARKFAQSVKLDGVVLSKMDGTAKGGIAFAVVQELRVPVRYVTTGEKVDDIAEFEPEAFVTALLG